jgi:hypothetical protein
MYGLKPVPFEMNHHQGVDLGLVGSGEWTWAFVGFRPSRQKREKDGARSIRPPCMPLPVAAFAMDFDDAGEAFEPVAPVDLERVVEARSFTGSQRRDDGLVLGH